MRALILGGTRFIGPFVVREFLKSGHSIGIFNRGKSESEIKGEFKRFLGDRNEIEQLSLAVRDFEPDCLVDLCSFVEHHQDVIEAIQSERLFRHILISSADVYRNFGGLLGLEVGEPDPSPLSESAPVRTRLYPYSGHAPRGEVDMEAYDKIPIEKRVIERGGCVVRLPMVYGPEDRQHRTAEVVARLQDGRNHMVMGISQSSWRSCRAHVFNVAQAIRLVAESSLPGEVFNVAEQKAFSEIDWNTAVANAMNRSLEIKVVADLELPEELNDPTDYRWDLTLETSKIRNELGYVEPLDFEKGLAETVVWQAQNLPEVDRTAVYEAEDRLFLAL